MRFVLYGISNCQSVSLHEVTDMLICKHDSASHIRHNAEIKYQKNAYSLILFVQICFALAQSTLLSILSSILPSQS